MQPDGQGDVKTVAKEQAGEVGRTAADAGTSVAQTTKEQAQNVVGEAKQQARDLIGEARTQVRDQAGTQKGRAVEGIRALGGELDQMAQQGGGSGLATEIARQAAQRAQGLADHLDRHEPADLLDQVRSFARRRPVLFLASAAVAGVVAGRLTKGLQAESQDTGPQALTGGQTAPALPVATGYDAGPAYVATTPGYATREPGFVEPGYVEPGYGEPGYEAPGTGFAEPGYVAPDPAYPAGGGYDPADPGYPGRTP
jgi:hypothetical protein